VQAAHGTVFDGPNVKAVEGLDIQTTIDINIQDVPDFPLRALQQKSRRRRKQVVVMEVKPDISKPFPI